MHAGISGGADLDPEVHGWTDETTAELTLHEAGREVVAPTSQFATPKLPSTGGYTLSAMWLLIGGLAGGFTFLGGSILIVRQRSTRSIHS